MKVTLSSILGAALLSATSLSAAADIDVMTQNQYIGADLAPVVAAATAVPFDLNAFNAAVVGALSKVAAGRPTDRARALAAEIAKRNPDVVGLQEAYKLECTPFPGFPSGPGVGCDDPAIRDAFRDRLQDTVTALLGDYVVAGKVTNLQIAAIPFFINGTQAVLAISDRDAILVRRGLPWANFVPPCVKSSDEGCNFVTTLPPLSTPLGTIAIERGFLAVDVTVKNRAYRVFNTHLEVRLPVPNEPATRLLQVGQAFELAGIAVQTWDPSKRLIVIGDINSDPRDTIPVPPNTPTPYQVFTSVYNFTDAWTMRTGSGDGLTCCQDEDLNNRRTEVYERIDMIFSLQRPSKVLNMRLLGIKMGDKTRPPGNGGLWPSDHSALVARLRFD
jgi:endonuclease/exonuclease/phosphatase family metal-dependent hydrolase